METDMKIIALWLSLTGFFLAFRWFRKDLHPAFYPGLTVSLLSVLTCVGGMADVLPETVKVLFILGLFFLVCFGILLLRKRGHVERKKGESRAFLWMLGTSIVLCAGLVLMQRGRFLYGYDDYSHWGIVSRILLKNDRLPTEKDGLMFPSYPLGAASFIYFCGQVLGSSGEACLLAQNIMLISFLISLQSTTEKKKIGTLLVTAVIPFFLFYNTSPYALSVDNLLGAAFMTELLLFFQEDGEQQKRVPEMMILLSGCVLIKNSGLFLTLGMTVLTFFRIIRSREKPGLALLGLLLPLLVYLAWRIHLKTSFSTFGKHYMSLPVYYATLRGKMRDLGTIVRVILPVMIHPLKNQGVLLIPAFALVYMASGSDCRGKQKGMLQTCAVLFLLYEVGVFVMYICSMGTGELLAQQGGDFPRYNGTLILGMVGILIKMVAQTMDNRELLRIGRLRLLLLAAIILTMGCVGLNMTIPQTLEDSQKQNPDAWALSRWTEGKVFSEDKEYAILFQRPEIAEYEQYMACYYLYPAKKLRLYGSGKSVPKLGEQIVVIDLRKSPK